MFVNQKEKATIEWICDIMVMIALVLILIEDIFVSGKIGRVV